MSPNKRNVIVGAVVLVALVALGWMILRFANKAANYFLSSGTPITFKAERADGVADGSPVKYLGVDVGRVTKVSRSYDDQRITIEALVNADPPLPANVQGVIRATSMLGASASIHLEPLEPQVDGEYLVAGSVIEARGTADFSALAEDVQRAQLIAHFGQAVEALQKQIENAGKVLDATREMVEDPQMREDVRETVASMREAAGSAEKIGKDLERFTGRLGKMSDQVDARMEQVADTLEHVQAMAARIDAGEGTAGKLVNDDRLYESLADAAAEIQLMVQDMRRLIRQWEEEGPSIRLGG